jgi:hypothetical protein
MNNIEIHLVGRTPQRTASSENFSGRPFPGLGGRSSPGSATPVKSGSRPSRSRGRFAGLRRVDRDRATLPGDGLQGPGPLSGRLSLASCRPASGPETRQGTYSWLQEPSGEAPVRGVRLRARRVEGPRIGGRRTQGAWGELHATPQLDGSGRPYQGSRIDSPRVGEFRVRDPGSSGYRNLSRAGGIVTTRVPSVEPLAIPQLMVPAVEVAGTRYASLASRSRALRPRCHLSQEAVGLVSTDLGTRPSEAMLKSMEASSMRLGSG